MIIAINGKAGAGKDTVGQIMQYLLLCARKGYTSDVQEYVQLIYNKQNVEGSGWEIKKFAGPLRKVAAILLGMEEEYLYTDEFKKSYLPVQWSYRKLISEGTKDVYDQVYMTGREFLQRLGTDAIRDGLHVNAWVNALMADYTADKKWIITDLRFINESFSVLTKNGIALRIHRKGAQSLTAPNHPSETALDNATFDYEIENNGTIEELYDKVHLFLQQLNLI